jgi:hypothetical protein
MVKMKVEIAILNYIYNILINLKKLYRSVEKLKYWFN